jgi:hypothetical protein
MNTVRFSKIVETAGKPNVHVLLVDPAKDPILQKAIKANRVMMVHQKTSGTKADYGAVGFEKGVMGQTLIFPKSLKSFADQRVVGINYDLLESSEVPNNEPLPKPGVTERLERRNPRIAKGAVSKEDQRSGESKQSSALGSALPGARVLTFSQPVPALSEEPNEAIEEIKAQVRQAMRVLEEGKQVAAFNLLKQLVEN